MTDFVEQQPVWVWVGFIWEGQANNRHRVGGKRVPAVVVDPEPRYANPPSHPGVIAIQYLRPDGTAQPAVTYVSPQDVEPADGASG